MVRIDLTPTEAKVNSLRRRRIPWSAVQAVTQEPLMGGRRVVLWTVTGERVPLRAPLVDFTVIGDGAFDDRFHVIGRWWLSHRGCVHNCLVNNDPAEVNMQVIGLELCVEGGLELSSRALVDHGLLHVLKERSARAAALMTGLVIGTADSTP
jgi:hypothetical protein